MNSTVKERDYFFDNYRFLLIFLVVVGHFIEPCFRNHPMLSILKGIIFSFHMPAFIFISGYFSKKTSSLKKLIQTLLIPYFVYEVVYYILYIYALHAETKLYLAYPKIYSVVLNRTIRLENRGSMVSETSVSPAFGFPRRSTDRPDGFRQFFEHSQNCLFLPIFPGGHGF